MQFRFARQMPDYDMGKACRDDVWIDKREIAFFRIFMRLG
jgi:hypothetical protein